MNTVRHTIKQDVYRQTTDFSDLMRLVACQYELYVKAASFTGPWISKQNSSNMQFLVPEKDEIRLAIGKPRSQISTLTYMSFIDSIQKFLIASKGRRALISPNPTTHHSAQFTAGVFEIKKAHTIPLRDDRGIRKNSNKQLYSIEVLGSEIPVYIELNNLNIDSIKHVILRPKLGKLGTPSTNRWEALLYTEKTGHLIEHVDSDLNPRWSGIL